MPTLHVGVGGRRSSTRSVFVGHTPVVHPPSAAFDPVTSHGFGSSINRWRLAATPREGFLVRFPPKEQFINRWWIVALRNLFRWRSKPTVRTFASMSLASGPITMQTPVTSTNWQEKAWRFYDVVPEMRLVVGYRAAALSKVKLKIGKVDGPEPDIVDTPQTRAVTDAVTSGEFLELLFGGVAKHSEAMSRIAQHLTIVGETYNVVIDDGDGDEWLILPPDHVDSSQLYIADGVRKGYVRIKHPLTGVDVRIDARSAEFNIMRLWNPHPHNFWDADSPTRGAISTLDKIQHMDAAVKAAARSRMTGGGLLFLPQEMALPRPSSTENNLSPEEEFQKNLYKAISTAIQNPESAEAAAPIISWVPGDVIDKIPKEPITFWSEFDKAIKDLRDTEIRRYAAGQPMPTEMITGVGEVNHWTGWHLSEEDLKFDIAPLAELICDHLTIHVVQPLLGVGWAVIPDFSELVTRPNRTPEAIDLKREGIISVGEARIAAGYPEEIPPDMNSEQTIRVESERPSGTVDVAPPSRPELTESSEFSAAELLVKDLLATAGQWILTHSGRENRQALGDVAAHSRHVMFRQSDGKAWEKAIATVREKYGPCVDDNPMLCNAAAYAQDLLVQQKVYDQAGLRACLVARCG